MKTELKLLRVKSNLTQEAMAKALNVSTATYNFIENGKRDGSKAFWLNVQNKFNIEDAEIWKMQK